MAAALRPRRRCVCSCLVLGRWVSTRRVRRAERGPKLGAPSRALEPLASASYQPRGLLPQISLWQLALLGHHVTVYECRDKTNRLNVLKLWEETERAFDVHLGLKFLDPYFSHYQRASTTRLQHALLKAALLLGVHIDVRPELDPKAKGGGFTLAHTDAFDALVLAAGHNRGMLDAFRQQATGIGHKHAGGAEPFAPGVPKRSGAATALVAHFEHSTRTTAAAEWMKALPEFTWTLKDAGKDAEELIQKNGLWAMPAATVAEQLEAFAAEYPEAIELAGAAGVPASPRGGGGGGPSERASSHHSGAATSRAPFENVVCYKNMAYECNNTTGAIEVQNLRGVPPSFYIIATVKGWLAAALVARMVVRTAAAACRTPQPLPRYQPSELLEWARKEAGSGDAGAAVTAAAFEEQLDALAKKVVDVFTTLYMERGTVVAGEKVSPPSEPFSAACRLLRNTEHREQWKNTVQIFDYSESRSMANAAEVVTAVDRQKRAKPLLVVHAGDGCAEYTTLRGCVAADPASCHALLARCCPPPCARVW